MNFTGKQLVGGLVMTFQTIANISQVFGDASQRTHAGNMIFFGLSAVMCLFGLWLVISDRRKVVATKLVEPGQGIPEAPIAFQGVTILDGRGGDPLNFPLKIYAEFKNTSSDVLYLDGSQWITDSVHAQLHVNERLGIGWQFNCNNEEGRTMSVPAGNTFRVWWGISLGYSSDEIKRKKNTRELGILVVSGNVGGSSVQSRFEI